MPDRSTSVPVASPFARNVDVSLLHPSFRVKAQTLLDKLSAQHIPFALFEGYRTPDRQAYLYASGRTRLPGPILTRARPWESYHQYGLAADFVLYENGVWSWDTSGDHRAWWGTLQKLGVEIGLEYLSFELPHLQLAGLHLPDLKSGSYPDGGDDTWRSNLTAATEHWTASHSNESKVIT